MKRADIYGDDDAAALRDLLFSWWEDRFLEATPVHRRSETSEHHVDWHANIVASEAGWARQRR